MKKSIKGLGLVICSIVVLSILSSSSVALEDTYQVLGIDPGDYTHYIEHEGRERSYRVHVPPSLLFNQPPVVIALHGGLGSADSMEVKTRFSEKADDEGFIVVYPNGIANLPRIAPNSRVWNAGHCCGRALIEDVNDTDFIRVVIEEVIAEYQVNPSHVFITGHSNGAMLTYRVGAVLSNMVTAIAPVAGTIGGNATENMSEVRIPDPLGPVPVNVIHGRLDPHVLYDGGHSPSTTGTRIDLSVNESVSFWVEHNDLDPIPETVVNGNVTIDTYSRGIKCAEVILYTIENWGHNWPGNPLDLDPELNATDVIWDFFKSQLKYTRDPSQETLDMPSSDGSNSSNIRTLDRRRLPDCFILRWILRNRLYSDRLLSNCGCT